jgi:hypothetical protein
VPRGEAGRFIAERNIAPGGKDQPFKKMLYLSESSGRTDFRAAIAGNYPTLASCRAATNGSTS